MGAEPSVIVEVDVEQNIARAYNPLFPNMNVTYEIDADKLVGINALDSEIELKRIVRDEYKAKYGI